MAGYVPALAPLQLIRQTKSPLTQFAKLLRQNCNLQKKVENDTDKEKKSLVGFTRMQTIQRQTVIFNFQRKIDQISPESNVWELVHSKFQTVTFEL